MIAAAVSKEIGAQRRWKECSNTCARSNGLTASLWQQVGNSQVQIRRTPGISFYFGLYCHHYSWCHCNVSEQNGFVLQSRIRVSSHEYAGAGAPLKTYTGLLKDIEDGHVEAWKDMQAPLIARNYYKLPEDAQMLDMIKCIRADEANHRDVNHTFASLDQKNGVNPHTLKPHK
ncbi:Alternative oxidase, partial [Globisporangium splendens]